MSDPEVERLAAEFAALNREFVAAERSNRRLRREIRELRANERRLTAQLEHVRSSFGWRVFAPFRHRSVASGPERRDAAKREA